jgi:ketosteroid isomerase-like protein
MSFDTVDKLNREFERGYNNGQVKEAVGTYASDARLFATDKQVYEGSSQIEKYYTNARAAGNSKVELHTGQVIQAGSDYIIEIRFVFLFNSFYHILFSCSQYKINTDGGNYVVVWKKDGGQWKKIIDIFN